MRVHFPAVLSAPMVFTFALICSVCLLSRQSGTPLGWRECARSFIGSPNAARKEPSSRGSFPRSARRRDYERWASMTLERLEPGMIDLVPELASLVPPAEVVDKNLDAKGNGDCMDAVRRANQSLQGN
jgi:hypothetical protein